MSRRLSFDSPGPSKTDVVLVDVDATLRREWAYWFAQGGVEILTAEHLGVLAQIVPGNRPLILILRIELALGPHPQELVQIFRRSRLVLLLGEHASPELELRHPGHPLGFFERRATPPVGLFTLVKRALSEPAAAIARSARPAADSGWVASSGVMRALESELARIANFKTSVLFVGQPGTGRRALAHRLIVQAERHPEPLTISMRALSSLGAARVALELRRRIADAPNETLLLTDLEAVLPESIEPFEAVLAEARVRTVGTATSALRDRIDAGEVPRSFFFRRAHHLFEVPPLALRKDDLPVLVRVQIKLTAERLGLAPPAVSREAMTALRNYAWPGNLPELFAAIERALAESAGETLTVGHFPFLPGRKASRAGANLTALPLAVVRDESAAAVVRAYVAALIEKTGGNIGQAADLAKMDRANFKRAHRLALATSRTSDEPIAELLAFAASYLSKGDDAPDARSKR